MHNINTHFKSTFEVERTTFTEDKSIFQIILEQSRSWLKQHYKQPHDQEYIYRRWFFSGGNLEAADLCTEVETIDYDKETGNAKHWNLRFEHNDQTYAHLKWRVDIELDCIDDSSAEFEIIVSWYFNKENIGEVPFSPKSSVPRLAKQLLMCDKLFCHRAGKELNLYATNLQVGDVQQFYEFLISEDRSIPIILMNKQNQGKDNEPDGIQNLFVGSAFVYWYDSADVQTALNEEWGQSNVELYYCPSDSIRMYLPHLDTQTDYDWERHPYFSLKEYTGRFQDLSLMLKQRILW